MGALNYKTRRNRRHRLAAELYATWTPRRLFTFGSSVGWAHWYDSPSDYPGGSHPYLYQDSAGTTPVTAVGQSVGLVLDRAYGGMRGPQAAGDPGFDGTLLPPGTPSSTQWYLNTSTATVTISGSALNFTGASSTWGAGQDCLTVGRTYEVVATVSSVTGGGVRVVNTSTIATATSAGTLRCIFVAASTLITLSASGTTTASVSGVTVREIPGTHRIQSSAPSRPLLMARVNMLLATESLGGSAWIDSGATVGAAIADPNGNLTAVSYARATGAADARYQTVSCGSNVNVVYARIKAGTSPTSLIYLLDATASAERLRVEVTWTGGVPSLNATVGSASTPVSVGNGWYAVTMQTSATVVATNTNRLYFYPGRTGSVNGDTAYMWGVDLRTADDAAKNIPSYQRVGATAADHDTAGFPHAAYPDGTDDFDTTSTGGGGTSGFFFCGVLTVSGGAGTARTIWSDTGTNTGYRVRINASNKLELAAGNGSAYTTVQSNETITAPGTYLLSAWDDGGVLAVQVGNAAAATTARPAVSAGTSTITSYRDNGAATSYFNGRDYGLVYLQTYPGETAHNRLKQWQARRAGITV